MCERAQCHRPRVLVTFVSGVCVLKVQSCEYEDVCVLGPTRRKAGGGPAWNRWVCSKKGVKVLCLGAGASSNRVAEAVLCVVLIVVSRRREASRRCWKFVARS